MFLVVTSILINHQKGEKKTEAIFFGRSLFMGGKMDMDRDTTESRNFTHKTALQVHYSPCWLDSRIPQCAPFEGRTRFLRGKQKFLHCRVPDTPPLCSFLSGGLPRSFLPNFCYPLSVAFSIYRQDLSYGTDKQTQSGGCPKDNSLLGAELTSSAEAAPSCGELKWATKLWRF